MGAFLDKDHDRQDGVLRIQAVSKGFVPGERVLRDISLGVNQGETLCVLGPSGCGKTTLLRLIGGFERPDSGEILHQERLISSPARLLPPEHRGIGMVFQDNALFPHLSVLGNVRFGLDAKDNSGWWPVSRKRRGSIQHRTGVDLAHLFRMTGLVGFEQRYPHELSGGQLQRVALARALAPRPWLLLLDEPFSDLDAALRNRLRDEVRQVLSESGTTSVLVTHDQEEAVNMADRIAVMRDGALVQVGTPADIIHRPATRFVASFFGINHFLPGLLKRDCIETELGRFPLSAPNPGATAETRAELLLRPNHIRASPNGKGTPARITRVQYLGVQALYTLALASGREIQALLADSPPLRPGDETLIEVRNPDPVVFTLP